MNMNMNPDYNTLLRFYRSAMGIQNTPVVPQPVPQMASQEVLPPQTVIQVNGKESVDALKMSANSSVLLMDMKDPIVWLCTSDGLGKVTSIPYDITPHHDSPPVDVNSLEARINNIEKVLTNLFSRGDDENGKSDVTAVESRKNDSIVEQPVKH